MAKTIYNKNVANPSDITASVFSSDEQLKYGEIVLCNNINEPGIYIFTKSDNGETKIQKMNSVDNIILKQDVDPSASGPVANGDTLYKMVSKFQAQINDLSGDGKSEAEKVNKIVAAVGINEDGSYKIISLAMQQVLLMQFLSWMQQLTLLVSQVLKRLKNIQTQK